MARFDKKSKKEDFDSKGYVKVHERLAEFRNAYKEGFLTTFRVPDDCGVSFRTVVCRNKEEAELYAKTGIAPATGHSFLPDDLSGEKQEEYAETVSVGRALANLGLKVEQGIASSEEMERVNGKADDDDDEEDEEDDEDDSDDDEDSDDEEAEDDDGEDDEDEEAEPKLKSSRRFAGRKSSRFGG